ncbi:MAG: Ig-like domain-containing protein [Anaeromyxobacter sp.]|nr:Ig-like domain-containing protein [Anaeromyxobacter sp.]
MHPVAPLARPARPRATSAGAPGRRALLAATALLALAACGRGCAPRSGQGGGAVALSPLPEPPLLSVAQEALPGDGGALAVVVARPQGRVAGDVRPAVTFSRPVVALGTVEATAAPPGFTLAPAVPGEWRWLGSATAEFQPTARLPPATAFTVTVPAGVRSLDGAVLAEPTTFSFETQRPALQEVSPAPGFRWATADQVVALLFDQPVADLAGHARLLVGGRPWPFGVTAVPVAAARAAEEARRGRQRPGLAGADDATRQVRYDLRPTRPLPLDAEVVLVVDGALAGQAGPLTMEAEHRSAFRTFGALAFGGLAACPWEEAGCHWGPLTFTTSNEVDLASLKGRVTVQPPVELQWDEAAASAQRVTLPGRFRPGRRYQVTVAAGVKDVFGQALAAPFTAEVAFRDLAPGFELPSDLVLLEASGDGGLPASAVNLSALQVRTLPLTPGALARALAADRAGGLDFSAAPLRSLDVRTERNATRSFPVPVRQHLAGSGATLFAVEVVAPEVVVKEAWEGWRRRSVVLGQLTDLAVHAKLGATSGLAWVTRLSDGAAVAGARLALYDRTGAERWSGATDADGLGRLPGLAELLPPARDQYDGVPFALLAARLGDDTGVTLSSWSGGFSPWAFDLPAGWDGKTPRELGGVWAERGLYRPGETAHLKGLVRALRLGRQAAPAAGTPVTLKVVAARGQVLLEKQVPLTAFGTFSAEVPLPADAPLGGAQVSATVPVEGGVLGYQASFRVEAYRAPQFKVDVAAPSPSLTAGDPLRAEVVARYLFGGALPGAPVRWTVGRETTDFEPPGHAGFAFGLLSWWWDDGEPQRSSDVAGAGEGLTGPGGALAIDAGRVEALANRTWTYTLEAEVEDVSRQRVAARTAVTVHPAALYAGARRPGRGFAEAGRADGVEVVAVAPDGTRQAGARLEVQVKRREWRFVKKKLAGGEWSSVNELVEEPLAACALTSAAEPVTCAFTPGKPGQHVAEVAVTDQAGRRQVTRLPFYATGSGWVSWQREDTDRLELVADRDRYQPGDTARLLVKSPWPEAEALLTVEREGVRSARRLRLTGAATTLEVPLGEEDLPNVFVSVVLARGRVAAPDPAAEEADPGRPAVKVGYVQLQVEKRSRRLAVALTPDAAVKRPRQRVQVAVEVKDWRGQGVPAEVTVWAVDEAVLRLTGYQPPDPVELLHPPRPLSVRVGEPLLHLVERRRYGEKGLSSGGGGGGDGVGSGFRSEFKTTVLFAPEVVTGADGRASVAFDLPDNLTTYRLMAVAVTRGDLAGGATASVRVEQPLLALPALPRLARVGDRFEAGVVVHAPGVAVKEVEVRAEAEGLTLTGPAAQRVALVAGRAEVRFGFRAERPGQAVLRFRVEGGGERDGLEQRLPVLLPVALEAVAVAGETRDLRREGLLPPGGIRADVGGLTVTLASTALGGFAENLRQLVEYPHGCLEQLASRLVPFVAVREVAGRFKLPLAPGAPPAWLDEGAGDRLGSRDPDEIVKRTVRAIEALQGPDGGYRYWSSSTCSSEYASSYAVLALGRAAEVGYPVDPASLARGQRYLAETVAAGRCTRCGFGCTPPGDAVRVAALHALARTRAPRASGYAELYARRAALPLFARAQLADAMFVGGGDRPQARALLQELLNLAKEAPTEVHLEEQDPRSYASLWSSDVRSSALLLHTLVDVSPEHPWVGKLAAYLARARGPDGRFATTQEAAHALMALTEVVRVKEREVPAFTGRVTLGGKEVASAPFQGRTTEVTAVTVPAAALPAAGGAGAAALPLDFRRDGTAGVLYYGALLRYAPQVMPVAPLERGLFVQRWFEPYGGGGQVRAARAGDLVRVRVRVASSQERRFLAVTVPLPAGLEIVDTTLASTALLRRSAREEGPGEGYDGSADGAAGAALGEERAGEGAWATTFWSPFDHEERRDDQLVLFADRLPPGVHLTSFVARATTPGEWTLAPAQAEQMYAPEVFGRSDGGTFTVVVEGR